MEGYSFTDIIWYVVVGWILLIFIYIFVWDYLRKRKAKKLKYEWNWVLKRLKVSSVKESYVSWDEDSSWYYLYRLEVKDETWNVYKSEYFKDAEHGWRTVEEMKVKYDGVTYDLSDKDNAIKQLNHSFAISIYFFIALISCFNHIFLNNHGSFESSISKRLR